MTHTEINRRLALAIGYLPEHIECFKTVVVVCRPEDGMRIWERFDFTDARITVALIERYKIDIEYYVSLKLWYALSHYCHQDADCAATLQEAVALAVIAGAGK